MRYGHFDDKNREYVIETPETPLPWINYLGSESYFGLISNTAGGYSFYKDARLRRLTRYRYNNAPLDVGGRYIYLRDNASDSARTWSPTWMPTQTPLDFYECRHGMGYTTIHSKLAGIESQTRYFVPLGENLEVWELTLTNGRNEPADLSVFSAIEFNLWDAMDDATNFQRNYSIGQVEVVDGVIYHKTEYRERRDHFAYFACSEKLAGFDTQRDDFLGAYRGWSSPKVVEAGQSANSITHGWQPIGSHHVKIQLKAGEQKKIIFILGYHENPKDAKFDPPDSQTVNKRTVLPTISRYLKADEVDKAFQTLHIHWEGLLEKFQVTTPDVHTNRMVNIWNAYQTMITFNMSRSASYFESGIGRGMGFRDSNQDLLGFVHLIPERAHERILDIAATQLETGGAYHQYQPLTKRGNNDVGSGFNDDPLWLVLAVVAYVKETGDFSILDEQVPYDNQPGSEKPLYEHLQRSIQYTLDRLGPHKLPLIGRADWNDCLNLNCFSDTPGQSFQTTTNKEGKVAESVLIAGLFVLAAKEMAELAKKVESQKSKVSPTFKFQPSTFYLEAASKMESTVWASGWDGDWFRRAYDDFSHVLGSKENAEGSIFIEPQGICVMADLGVEDGRAEKALNSVNEHLATPHGIVLQQPAFSKYYLHLGEISSYPPGYKENAGIFCHSNPWVMIAETKIGRGDKAYDYYLRINPSAREEISELHRCEPYVYAQMIAGKDAITHGEAKNSWLTGTAAWNYVAISQWILGIRPTYDGLRVAPVVPSAWNSFEAVRSYRGVRYVIQVERKGKGNEVQLEVDGKSIKGSVIPMPVGNAKEVRVRVTLIKALVVAKNLLQFPKDFIWGVATASYQIEGAWDKHGKGESIWDRFAHTQGKIKNNDTGDVADDHYRLWKKDIGLMKRLGLKGYRFSISWPRVFPTGRGKVNKKGLDFYSRLVDRLLNANIIPFITLNHWDLPQALEDEGGWPMRSTAEAFVEYTDVITRALGDRVKNWTTHNEPAVVAWLGYSIGEHAPGLKDHSLGVRAAHHLLLSHGWAMSVIHSNSQNAEAGITLNIGWKSAASNSVADLKLARQDDGQWFRWFADPVYGRGYPSDMIEFFTKMGALPNGMDFVQQGDMDVISTPTQFVGLNYYARQLARANDADNSPQVISLLPKTPDNWTDMGWENFPDGLTGVLGRVYFNYQPLKIYITENGASYSTPPDENGNVPDVQRINYLKSHLAAAHRAVQAGVPLAGYFIWSLMDNFEWAHGYSQRFGIVWVDYETQERILKDSAKWYKAVIKKNGF